MGRMTALAAAILVTTAMLAAPARAEMAQGSATEKVKTMTKAQWSKLQAEWKKDRAKFTACNDKAKAAKLKGRKRWAAIYECMLQ